MEPRDVGTDIMNIYLWNRDIRMLPTISENKAFPWKFGIFVKKSDMIVERTKNEILVRLPAYVDLTELQNMLDFLQYKETTSKSKAKQSDADELSRDVNKSIMSKVKARRGLK